MFPTFISILDIQSWWEVPSIAHFCSLFRTAFNLLDFDIEDLEESLLADGTEESSWLQELIVRLLSGCLPDNEISTSNYQMFLRRLFRQKCQEHDRYNPFNTDIDFQLLPLRTKVDILHALCDFRLDADDVLDQLKNLEADSLRVEPLGYDGNDSAYWYFYGTRLYREDFKLKNNKKKSVWQVICFTEDDWFQLTKKFKKSTCKTERQLHHTLNENFLPELPRLFKEKESQARRRLLENCPRRASSRIQKLVETEKVSEKLQQEEKERLDKESLEKRDKEKKWELGRKRQESYERRTKLKAQSEDDSLSEASEKLSDSKDSSEVSENRYEMANNKRKKIKSKQRKVSAGSASSKDTVTAKSPKRNKKSKKNDESSAKTSPSKPATTVGRQTNNSLSAATGQILIQSVANTNKKKLKTSQVFRQTDEDLQIGMHKILDFVKNHEDAWPFADPVEEEYAPNYYSIVRKPMDLQTMEERLESGYYKNFSKFRSDFQLIVDNCRLYNGAENEYTEMVDNLLQVFEKATEKYLDQISSDDEIAVEVPELDVENKTSKKKKDAVPVVSKRKPMLVAQTDQKRDRSKSEESVPSIGSASYESLEEKPKQKSGKVKKVEKEAKVTKKHGKNGKSKKEKGELRKDKSEAKKEKVESKKEKLPPKKEKLPPKKDKLPPKKDKSAPKKEKEELKKSSKDGKSTKGKKSTKKQKNKAVVRSRSPTRSPSRSPVRSNLSSPPPSWPPSSPDDKLDFPPAKKNAKVKRRNSQELTNTDDSSSKVKQKKQSNFSNLFDDVKFGVPTKDKTKPKEEYSPPLSPKPKDKHNKLRETIEKLKAKSDMARIKTAEYDFEFEDHPKENKDKAKKQEKDENVKSKIKEKAGNEMELEADGNSTMDSVQSESKKSKKNVSKTSLSVNKNASTMDALSIATEQTLKDINKWLDDTPKFCEFSSASNSPSYVGLDEFDIITGRIDPISGKKSDKVMSIRKDGVKDVKKRPFRDPAKFFKRREIQRTIDRLQPGKSKGNLISNVQSIKVDESFPLGPLSKIKDTKNSLIVKTDTNAPKLSLGSVLDSFGKHKFVDDQKKEEEKVVMVEAAPKEDDLPPACPSKMVAVDDSSIVCKEIGDVKEDSPSGEPAIVDDNSGGATPNLSAWFKAFGAPKMLPPQKKNDSKADGKESEDVSAKSLDTRKPPSVVTASPNHDSPIMIPGQPVPRQRKISTGSSMSERSSFSQDMDSPRVGMDERGAYPAPYPSPLHRSPSGASPVMASPRPDISPKAAAYPTINGQIRVGFYQDTVSNKSSPDKSCSPRELPQSPYPQYSEHVYTPNTTESSYYSYANSPYYTHPPNYSSTNPTPPYNMEMSSSSYYDTSKSLTDQYQAKAAQNYSPNSPASNHSSPAPHPQQSPGIRSPGVLPQHSPSIHSPHSPQNSPSIHSQHSPSIHSQHSPSIHSQHSPSIHSQHSPSVQSQHSPDVLPQQSPGVYQQHSPNIVQPNSPIVHSQSSNSSVQCQNAPMVILQHPQNVQLQQPGAIQHPTSPSVDVYQKDEQGQGVEKVLQQQQQPPQSAMFPVKKRVYTDNDSLQGANQRFEAQREVNRNIQMEGVAQESLDRQEVKDPKSYIHQNIPELKGPVPFGGSPQEQMQKDPANIRNMNYGSVPVSNPYGPQFSNESNFLNIPTARMLSTAQQGKIDISKYTNMGYNGPEVNYTRSLQHFARQELNYTRTTIPSTVPQKQQVQQSSGGDQGSLQNTNNLSVSSQLPYKGVELSRSGSVPQQTHGAFNVSMNSSNVASETAPDRLSQVQEIPSGYKPEVSIPRPTYNTPSIEVDQPLSLGRNITNLSHIVDRFGNDDCIITGLQTPGSFYSDKGSLGTSHMFNKPVSTSTTGSGLFSQAIQSYGGQNVQGSGAAMYNRQMTELQGAGLAQGDAKGTLQVQPQVQEKKSKKRKSNKSVTTTNTNEGQQQLNTTNQGFQSYAGLKGNPPIEPSAISLKTSSVVPGSAFNFGPTPAGLGLGPGLYGDKDTYPNFLEDFRSAPNYYMAAAAAAHHRPPPESNEKQARAAHQNTNPQGTSGYPFLGAPQARPGYPIGGPFIPNAQAQLMDTSSPLYQHYLQAGVLNQGLLGPPGAYPPGYHPALSMRQPYDSMTRPPWL